MKAPVTMITFFDLKLTSKPYTDSHLKMKCYYKQCVILSNYILKCLIARLKHFLSMYLYKCVTWVDLVLYLLGIERADSLTADLHKGFNQNYTAGVVLFRQTQHKYTLNKHTPDSHEVSSKGI